MQVTHEHCKHCKRSMNHSKLLTGAGGAGFGSGTFVFSVLTVGEGSLCVTSVLALGLRENINITDSLKIQTALA